MNFLAPLGALFALSIPAVIVLYLLKLKRVEMPISSALLWRQSLEDLKANTPFQKLKKNLLLLLQIIILFFLTFAVMRPVLNIGGLEGQSFIVLIDNSASMSATDVEPTRLGEAKKLVIDLINDMSMGDRMMMISFASNASVLTPFEQDKATLRAIVRSVEPTETQTNIVDALRNAESAARMVSNPELVIVSDGQFTIPSDMSLVGKTIRYVPIGISGENVGIIDLVVRQDYAFEENYELLAGLQNTGAEERTFLVELWGEGDVSAAEATSSATTTPASNTNQEPERKLMDSRSVTLGPGVHDTIIFKDEYGIFPEKVEVILDSNDYFTADDRAWAIIPKEETTSILLVTSSNYYLQRVLNLDPRVQLSIVPLNGYTGPGDHDIVVFDSFTPPALVGGNYVFINSIPPLEGWTMGEELDSVPIVDWDRFHPLTRYLNLDNLAINKCYNLGVPGWVEIIAESRETPLIMAFEHQEIRGIVTAFDIYDSDWPLRVSYPIFYLNLVDWFTSDKGLSRFMKKTGDILILEPPEDINASVQLERPEPLDTRTFTFSDDNPIYFPETTYRGLYDYRKDGELLKRYAVNLLSQNESIIAPKLSLQAQESEIVGESTTIESNREIWRTLALIALIVLILEWMVYVKRARYSF